MDLTEQVNEYLAFSLVHTDSKAEVCQVLGNVARAIDNAEWYATVANAKTYNPPYGYLSLFICGFKQRYILGNVTGKITKNTMHPMMECVSRLLTS